MFSFICLLYYTITHYSLENHERVSFFINMYHCLMAHNLIIFGPPAMSSRTQFFQELNSYIKYDRQEI
jgi:hypothetical protein